MTSATQNIKEAELYPTKEVERRNKRTASQPNISEEPLRLRLSFRALLLVHRIPQQ